MHSSTVLLSLPAATLLTAQALAQTPAFPGAQGFGGHAAGGRGGDVYTVTNLNTSGAGSLAEGLNTAPSSGRTIVFAVSGYIPLSSTLRLAASKVTIAGQTAPGDGVGLRGANFRISGDDVIVRHLRFRHGKNGAGGDCLNLDSGSDRCVLDHIAMQFSTDENMSSFGSPPENLTLQWSLNAWGLLSHSAGGLWDQNHATCHHTLWAHNHTRDPKARPSGVLDWVNNVTFDYGIGFIMGDSATPADWKANVRGSYFICPPGNIRGYALSRASLDRNGNTNFSLHLDNCRWDRDGDTVLDGTNPGYGMATGTYKTLTTPVATTASVPVTLDDPTVAWKKIVSSAGPLRLDVNYTWPLRDEVDARLVQNLVTQTGSRIERESDLTGVSGGGFGTLAPAPAPVDTDRDGMPDFYEMALGWNPAVQDHNSALPSSGGVLTGTTFMPSGTASGYTRLEEYLHFKAIPHGSVPRNVSGAPTSLQVNLAKYTAGFSASPVFTTANVSGGTVTVAGGVATFTPSLNYSGRARFDFTVTDAQGHSWTQTCGIVVTNAALPRDLTWRGTGSAWDTASLHWQRADTGAAVAFGPGDRVAFTQSGSAQPAVNIPAAVLAGSIEVNAAANYTFSGAGGISSSGDLTKRGAGTLTVSNTGGNSFARIVLAEGRLNMGGAGLLGTAPLRLEGGTFSIGGSPSQNPITVAGPAIITGGSGGGTADIVSVTGAAPLTIAQTSTFDLAGDIGGYTGTMTFTGSGQIRINENNTGSSAATFDLASAGTNLAKRTTVGSVALGALRGIAGSTLQGATGNTSATTYVIGGNGATTTFAGNITNGGGVTGITKAGGGNLILTGAGSHTGTTLVSEGDLTVNGTLGSTAVTIADGAKLRGAGSMGGGVTAQSGAQVSPGAATNMAGTLTIGGGLNMQGATLSLQLSGSPSGANDKVVLNGGTLALSGTNPLQINLTDGVLGEGIYELISGGTATTGSAANVSWTPPSTARQTFTLSTPPGKLILTVTGQPATLRWLGTATAWDSATANWANTTTGVNPDMFREGDAVLFDDSATSGAVSLAAAVSPRSVTVNNAARAYSLSGSPVNAAGRLVKNGTGTLTLNGANTFTGGTTLNAGTIALGNATANAGALGGGAVTMQGGTLRMFSAGDATHAGTLAADLVVAGTAELEVAPRCGFGGDVSGGGILDYWTTYVRADVTGNWSGFTGTLRLTTDAGGGDFRIASSYAWPGLPQASVQMASGTWFYFSGITNSGAGTTIEIGELSGPAGARLRGGVTGGRALTYRIGGRTPAGGSATFDGSIAEQNTSALTNYVKTGAGTWRIAGGTWNGGTTVEQGILEITGEVACASGTTVESGAALVLDSATLEAESLTIESGGALQVKQGGTVDAECSNLGSLSVESGTLTLMRALTNSGTVDVRPGAGITAAAEVVNDSTMRFHSGARLLATGGFVNNGVLDLLASPDSLPPGFVNNGSVILNSDRRILTASRSGTVFTCTVQGYAGHSYQLQSADSPAGPWADSGAPVAGAGSVITFTATSSATRRFHRVRVTP